MSRVVLIHWRPEEAEGHAAGLRKAGHRVRVMAPDGMPDLRALRADPPDALVIDLGRLPSQGRAVGIALRQQRATRAVPLVFVGGGVEKTARVKRLLPDAFYTSGPSLPATLRRALRSTTAPRIAKRPVVPGTMTGYSGTPLPRKLGIKPGSRLALIGAPGGFERTLGPLLECVTLRPGARRQANVVLLFVRSRAELARRLAAGAAAMGDPGALWIAWPKKASGVESDLGEQTVRDRGLAAGLVDYKIAAIDATWAGLCFARRKPRR
jgi:hypothetical protein